MNNVSNVVIALEAARFLTKRLSLASATLLIYDHALNLGDEVEHFWNGSWTFSRAMYLCVARYQLNQILLMKTRRPRTSVLGRRVALCTWDPLTTLLHTANSVITLRVWYMFSRSPMIKSFAIMAFATSTIATVLLAGFLWKYVKGELSQGGTPGVPTSVVAWIYAPALAIHSILFLLKVYRFVTSPACLQRNTLLWRFVKEHTKLHLVEGLLRLYQQTHMFSTLSPLFSLIVAMTIVSVCRAMLSIVSLAATAHVDPAWLLNHAELSRVHWRPGATEGEIFVEVYETVLRLPITPAFLETPDSLASVDELERTRKCDSMMGIRTGA
ncbi:hypothetical protein BS17DRAFT_698543 [Gyrodon lividus]|nr:hypothetical protein BS17DRAFT_698543 [Gyrodon lividus]